MQKINIISDIIWSSILDEFHLNVTGKEGYLPIRSQQDCNKFVKDNIYELVNELNKYKEICNKKLSETEIENLIDWQPLIYDLYHGHSEQIVEDFYAKVSTLTKHSSPDPFYISTLKCLKEIYNLKEQDEGKVL